MAAASHQRLKRIMFRMDKHAVCCSCPFQRLTLYGGLSGPVRGSCSAPTKYILAERPHGDIGLCQAVWHGKSQAREVRGAQSEFEAYTQLVMYSRVLPRENPLETGTGTLGRTRPALAYG